MRCLGLVGSKAAPEGRTPYLFGGFVEECGQADAGLGYAELDDGGGLVLVGFGGGEVLFEEAGADVVVIGAGVHWSWRLNGDFRR
jgi:hypothetical protein